MNNETDVLIIGAGATGLMAARELAKAGKEVTILEARERIGGRIWALDEKEFGYPAQAGGEFVHGDALTTKSLLAEAGIKWVPYEGEIWSVRSGALTKAKNFLENNEVLKQKLHDLKEDISISLFLKKYFADEKYAGLRNSIIKVVEGYDAADPEKISTFTLRDEWLGHDDREDGKIIGGYGALLDFLQRECENNGVKIILRCQVASVTSEKPQTVTVKTTSGKQYGAKKIIVTAALPTIQNIDFTPSVDEKMKLISKIGFGSAVKIILKFKNQWWNNILEKDLSKMGFMISNEEFMTWWTQYPQHESILVGFMAGPIAEKYKNSSEKEILAVALQCLVNIFKVERNILENCLQHWRVFNWPADPLARGAYSYSTTETKNAYERLAEPIQNTLFFAGEATNSGERTATVEAAFLSGKEVARRILDLR